jgi:dTDP-4-amino-4,6-dideoxygalactose transaminase
VVSPTLTFAASCNPILYEGARPVFIDSERESWNLDPALLIGFLPTVPHARCEEQQPSSPPRPGS